MRCLETLVQGNHSREELRFKSSTDGNSEGNSLIGNKVKEAALISRQHDTYPRGNSDTICANTWFILAAGGTMETRGPAATGGRVTSAVCLQSDREKLHRLLSSFMPLSSGSHYQ